MSAGGRKGNPVFKWETSSVQEAGRALGACTGEGEYQKPVPLYYNYKSSVD